MVGLISVIWLAMDDPCTIMIFMMQRKSIWIAFPVEIKGSLVLWQTNYYKGWKYCYLAVSIHILAVMQCDSRQFPLFLM